MQSATVNDPSPQQAAFHVEAGDWISLTHDSASNPTSAFAEVRSSNDEAFVISISRVPRWMTESVEVDGEIRHEEGLDRFASIVVNISTGPNGDWITLTQPTRSWRYNRRASRRVEMDLFVRYSILDEELHPGQELTAELDDLSVTGMRMATETALGSGSAIVASLELNDGRLSIVGDIVDDAETRVDGRYWIRVAFRRLRDNERRLLTRIVAASAGVSEDEVATPMLQRPGPPRRVVEAYCASGDRRR